jgi:glucuronokinase
MVGQQPVAHIKLTFRRPAMTQQNCDVKTVQGRAFARAALIGNPSDGYYGNTISLIVKNFAAAVSLTESAALEVEPAGEGRSTFGSLDDFLRDVNHSGYASASLIKASIKRFAQRCALQGIELPSRNFTLRHTSNIPVQVGLAGSSAIVTATLRALSTFYGVSIRRELLPALALAVEEQELGIAAGLQDRVAQVYEGLTYMDFDRTFMARHGHGQYEALDPALAPPLFIAYQTEPAESSAVFHNDIRRRYDAGDPLVIEAMQTLAQLALEGRGCLLTGDHEQFARLMDRNFDVRRTIYDLNPSHIAMIDLARNLGAAANFTGSGGAVIGVYRDEAMFDQLQRAFAAQQCAVIKPMVGESDAKR